VRLSTEPPRFELLAAAAEVADGTLPLETTVDRLLDIVVPAFADVAVLDAIAAGGGVRRLGVRLDARDSSESEQALLRRTTPLDAPVGVAKAVAGGKTVLFSPVEEHHLRVIASGEHDLDVFRSLDLREALLIPLRARGRITGALVCCLASSGRRYRAEDVRFGEVLSGRISLALDNAGLSRRVGALEQQLESTLANLAEAVLVRDSSGRMVFANPAVAKLLGFASAQEMGSASAEQLMGMFDAFDEHGRRLTLEDLPSAIALHGGSPGPLLVRNVVRETGAERWLLHKTTPVFDHDGQLSLVVNVIEDVTEVKRAELAQRLLAEAGTELSSSLDFEQTLQRVAALAVPQLADWCGVRIRGQRDELVQVAVAHVDPAKMALAREFGERYPTRMSDSSGVAEVVRSGRAQLLREITPEMISAADISEEQAALVRDLEMRSVIIVPLAVPGQAPLGAITLVMAESGRTFDERNLVLAEELGRRAAVAVENARLYTERSRIASTLQQSLLPDALPQIDGFRLASLYRPAGEHVDVGGDFYDAFAIPDGWLVLVGDVTGRGPEAAALTSLARYTMRTAARLLGDPIAALQQLNTELLERSATSLVTIGCALLFDGADGSHADVILAGHPPPIHLSIGEPRQVGEFGEPLGAYVVGQWRAARIALAPGDQLILYTDGVIDTVGDGERFGESRLADALRGATSASDAVQRVDRAIREFARGPQADDTAVLAVERVAAAMSAEQDREPLLQSTVRRA